MKDIMTDKKTARVVVRPKRQVTLPRQICEALEISPGDVLELTVEGAGFTARPKKKAALEALQEIRRAFERSGVTEEELQQAGRLAREDIARERYGVEA